MDVHVIPWTCPGGASHDRRAISRSRAGKAEVASFTQAQSSSSRAWKASPVMRCGDHCLDGSRALAGQAAKGIPEVRHLLVSSALAASTLMPWRGVASVSCFHRCLGRSEVVDGLLALQGPCKACPELVPADLQGCQHQGNGSRAVSIREMAHE